MTELSIDEIIKEGLAGNPVKLKNGIKSYIITEFSKLKGIKQHGDAFYIGISLDDNGDIEDHEFWDHRGNSTYNEAYNIVSIWEDDKTEQAVLLEKAYKEFTPLFGTDLNGVCHKVIVVGKMNDNSYIVKVCETGELKPIEQLNVPAWWEEVPEDVDITKPPKQGDGYWYLTFDYGKPVVRYSTYTGTTTDENRFARNNFFKSKEALLKAFSETGLIILSE